MLVRALARIFDEVVQRVRSALRFASAEDSNALRDASVSTYELCNVVSDPDTALRLEVFVVSDVESAESCEVRDASELDKEPELVRSVVDVVCRLPIALPRLLTRAERPLEPG